MEHRLARLVQLGIRQARYFGRVKTKFQLYLAATVMPPQQKEKTRRKILVAFHVDPRTSSTGLQITTLPTANSYSCVIENPFRLMCVITPLIDGKWTAEAWEVDEQDRYVLDGRHFGVSSERVWDSPADAIKGLYAFIGQDN